MILQVFLLSKNHRMNLWSIEVLNLVSETFERQELAEEDQEPGNKRRMPRIRFAKAYITCKTPG